MPFLTQCKVIFLTRLQSPLEKKFQLYTCITGSSSRNTRTKKQGQCNLPSGVPFFRGGKKGTPDHRLRQGGFGQPPARCSGRYQVPLLRQIFALPPSYAQPKSLYENACYGHAGSRVSKNGEKFLREKCLVGRG